MSAEERLKLIGSICKKKHLELIEKGTPWVKTDDILEFLELLNFAAIKSDKFLELNHKMYEKELG